MDHATAPARHQRRCLKVQKSGHSKHRAVPSAKAAAFRVTHGCETPEGRCRASIYIGSPVKIKLQAEPILIISLSLLCKRANQPLTFRPRMTRSSVGCRTRTYGWWRRVVAGCWSRTITTRSPHDAGAFCYVRCDTAQPRRLSSFSRRTDQNRCRRTLGNLGSI
jgi:hypothetical protein